MTFAVAAPLVLALCSGVEAATHAVDWNSYFSASVDKSDVDASPGDTLSFTWSGGHNVYLMTDQTAWNNCDFTGATDLGSTSPLSYTIPTTAAIGSKIYFACEIPGHCSAGQKNEVDVISAPAGTAAEPEPEPEPEPSTASPAPSAATPNPTPSNTAVSPAVLQSVVSPAAAVAVALAALQ